MDFFLRSVDSKKKIRVARNSLISEFWTTLIFSIIVRVQLRWQRPFRRPHKVKQRRVYRRVVRGR